MKLCPKCQKQFSDDANFCPVDAARLVPLEAQAAGADALTSRFELGPSSAEARTGAVYGRPTRRPARPCVVKLVAPAVVALPGVAQRLERELKQLERVKSAGVAQVLASGKRTGRRRDLGRDRAARRRADARRSDRRARPDPARPGGAISSRSIGEALIEAAQVGVVHRDLAPKNILFARRATSSSSTSRCRCRRPTRSPACRVRRARAGRGSPGRSALEPLLPRRALLLRADRPDAVRRLGRGGSQAHIDGSIKPPSQLVPVPAPVEAVIMRALDRSPTKRFLTVRQFVDEVPRVGHGEVIELKHRWPMGTRQPSQGRARADAARRAQGPARRPDRVGSDGADPVARRRAAPRARQSAAALRRRCRSPMQAPQLGPQSGPARDAGAARRRRRGHRGRRWPPPPAVAPASRGAAASLASACWSPAPASAQRPVVAAPVRRRARRRRSPPQRGKKKRGGRGDAKGKFRETMWFKKGDLDAQAAVAAAEERARTGKDGAADKADSKAIDERYNDDGSITRGDKEKYSPAHRRDADDVGGPGRSPRAPAEHRQGLRGRADRRDEGLPQWIKIAIARACRGRDRRSSRRSSSSLT